MAKKSLKQRIFFFEKLENIRKNRHTKLKERIAVSKRNISFLMSGFLNKEEYVNAVSEGFSNLSDFQIKTGFEHYSVYKKRMVSGFATKLEWEEAAYRGFETKAEHDLAIAEKFSNKEELVTEFTKIVEGQSKDVNLIEDETRSFKKLISSEYNKQQLQEYKKEIIKNKEELEAKSEFNAKLNVINHEDFTLLLIIFENKRLKLLENISNLLSWIETRFPYLEKWNRLLDVLNSFRSHVPVQLDRVAELSKLTAEDTEPLLDDIISEIPSLGEYLQLEQVFIKKTWSRDDLSILLEEMRTKKIILESKSNNINCLHCGFRLVIDKATPLSTCPNCNQIIPTCHICRGLLFEGDEILIDENCENLFHKRHILEWVNVQGTCPVCRTRLNEKSLKKYEKR